MAAVNLVIPASATPSPLPKGLIGVKAIAIAHFKLRKEHSMCRLGPIVSCSLPKPEPDPKRQEGANWRELKLKKAITNVAIKNYLEDAKIV